MSKMVKRKSSGPMKRPEGWIFTLEGSANGRRFGVGDELTVLDHSGSRIRVRFVEIVENAAGAVWFTCFEIDKRTGAYRSTRSFGLERIKVVHSKRKKVLPRGARKGEK